MGVTRFGRTTAVVAAAVMVVGLAGFAPPETWWPTELEVPYQSPGSDPVVGDFDEDGLDDIYWYAAGSSPEELWTARPEGGFDEVPAPSVTGRYDALAGDFDGDGDDDILWHGVNGGGSVWTFEGGRVASRRTVDIGRAWSSERTVVIERASGPDHVGVVVGHRTSIKDGLYIWDPRKSFADAAHVGGGTYPQPLTGDFDGDGHGDVLLYGFGSEPDAIGWGRADGEYDSRTTTIYGQYMPAVLDADGDGRDDIAFFARRRATAANVPVWRGRSGRWFAKSTVGAPTAVGDTWVQEDRGDGRDNVIIRVDAHDDQVWELGVDGAAIIHTITDFNGGVPHLGHFSDGTRDDMYLWNDRLLLSPQG